MKSFLKNIIAKSEINGRKYKLNTSFRFSSGQNGERYGMGTGSSLEFLDHREYQPGDDIRHIDWNAMGRSDKPIIRIFREETAPQLEILVDGSCSMALMDTKKYDGTAALTSLLKSSALNSGCSTRIYLLKDSPYILSSSDLLMCADNEFKFDFKGDTGANFLSRPPKLRSRSIRVLISDLFWEADPFSIVRRLSLGASLTVVIQLVSKYDETPEFNGNMRLIDSETLETIELMTGDSIIKEYVSNFIKHCENWRRACEGSGVAYTYIKAEDFLNSLEPEDLIKQGILIPEGVI